MEKMKSRHMEYKERDYTLAGDNISEVAFKNDSQVTMMTLKDKITIILDIEKNVQVDRLCYKGLNIWPLLRLKLNKNLGHNNQVSIKKNKHNENLEDDRILIMNQYRKISESYHKLLDRLYQKLNPVLPKEVLFLSYFPNRYLLFEGKYYNKFLDPIKELLTLQKQSFMTLETFDEIKEPKYFETNKISKLLITAKNLGYLRNKIKHKEEKVRKMDCFSSEYLNFKNYLHEIKILDCLPSDEKLIEEFEIFFETEKLFGEILKIIEPKICFFVCYYTEYIMAFIRACNKLSIKSVDVQHGAQNDYHLFYTNWTKLPLEGYDTLPNFFWCWGEKSAERFTKWSTNVKENHKPIVGSNVWLLKYLDSNLLSLKTCDTDGSYLQKLKGKKILITLQSSPPTELFPEILVDAINRSSNKTKWLIRMHPTFMYSQKQKPNREKLYEIISHNKWDFNKVEIENSSKIPLFYLLKQIDYHITQSSTVAYEAELFDVPTIIIGKLGQENFSDDITKGYFFFADTSEEILDIICSNKKTDQRLSPYIEIDKGKAERALEHLLK